MAEESRVLPINYDEYFKSWSVTQSKVIKLRHVWTINNFSFYRKKTDEYFQSPTFSAEINGEKSEWYLQFFPKGYNDRNNVSLHLYRLDTSNEQLAKFRFSVMNAKGENVRIKNCHCRFKIGSQSAWIINFMKQAFLFNETNGILLDDKFTLAIDIITTIGHRDISGKLTTLPSHRFDFTFLFESTEFSDVTLSAGEKEFRVHKAILAAQSPVFRAMFQHGLTESKTNQVEITDIDEEGLHEMLRYMYTGKINKLEEMAPRLLGIAEKYAMDDLKITCENVLAKGLSVENVTEMFLLSDRFGAKELKIQVKEFIAAHAAVVKDTPEFKAMVTNHPHLGMEAFCALNGDIHPLFVID